jgi:predicted acyltransferase
LCVVSRWGVWSVIFAVLSALLQILVPYNKKIWSLSFVLVTAGLAGTTLSLCYFFVDIFEWKGKQILQKLSQPFVWLGMNPIAIFALMIFIEVLLLFTFHVKMDGEKTSLWVFLNTKVRREKKKKKRFEFGSYLLGQLLESWLPSMLASLIFSLFWVVVYTLIAFGM